MDKARMTTEQQAHDLLVQADDLRKKAMALLAKSDQMRFKAERKRELFLRCCCGHRKLDHAVSHSVNYTAGVCRKCSCMNFLLA